MAQAFDMSEIPPTQPNEKKGRVVNPAPKSRDDPFPIV
jgi:hypothetical protein